MRESLLETFDEIYILNLHGSAKKQETAPDGGKDDNVFDITVGVAIAIFVKLPPNKGAKRKKQNATIHHADLWGLRKNKYDWLNVHNAANTEWTTFQPDAPDFRFVPRNAKYEKEWENYWSIRKAFVVSGNAIKTERDRVSIHFTRKEAETTVRDFRTLSVDELRKKYDLFEDSRDWSVDRAKKDTLDHPGNKLFAPILYRPFDVRQTWFSGRAKGFMGTPGRELMQHLNGKENLALLACRQQAIEGFDHVFCSTNLAECCTVSNRTKEITSAFPLYLYPNGETEGQVELVPHENGRRPNLSAEFIKHFSETIGLKFIADGHGDLKKTFGPEDVFHYAYAIFHSPSYRKRFTQFLACEFPRLPVTGNDELFTKLSKHGARLVALHTLREVNGDDVSFDVPGSNMVEQANYITAEKEDRAKGIRRGRVYINSEQYFEGISPAVWQMRIGSYQVCEKWLKDRKGRTLTHDEIEHYQRTVSALAETRTLMAQIDSLISDHGGWPLE
jgi:predicted helicase